MKTNDPRDPWTRLTAAARNVRDERETAAPYGFSTRVAALAFAQERKGSALLDLFALRALGVAALIAVFSIAMNYSVFSTDISTAAVATTDEVAMPVMPADDAVAVVLDALAD